MSLPDIVVFYWQLTDFLTPMCAFVFLFQQILLTTPSVITVDLVIAIQTVNSSRTVNVAVKPNSASANWDSLLIKKAPCAGRLNWEIPAQVRRHAVSLLVTPRVTRQENNVCVYLGLKL